MPQNNRKLNLLWVRITCKRWKCFVMEPVRTIDAVSVFQTVYQSDYSCKWEIVQINYAYIFA